jgi:Tetratricopeptide repeat/NB-ARC domain
MVSAVSTGGGAGQRQESWSGVPARNPGFKGREAVLSAIHDAMAGDGRVAVQALLGMAGVGKTQIAIEFAHRFAFDYDIVWWISAERPEAVLAQFLTLAVELGWASADEEPELVRREVVRALHRRGRWLLVFDSAEHPADVAPWLPGGRGHVLITSTAQGWDDLAVPRPVDVFTRAESRAVLQGRVAGLADADADKVAAEVGDLPLAVAQAAGYMASTGTVADEYVRLLRTSPAVVLELGKPWQYPGSLAAAAVLSFDQMQSEDPAGAEVAAVCAYLAPEPVPTGWFPAAAGKLPAPLGVQAANPVAWGQVVYRLHRSGLVRVEASSLVMHRLTQAIIRDHLSADRAMEARAMAETLLAANAEGDETLPENWPQWARLLPHVLAADPAASENPDMREAGVAATWYLFRQGDYEGSHNLARDLYEKWRGRLGADDPSTLGAATSLTAALSGLGRHSEARHLDQDTLARRRRVLGDDDSATLITANNLASNLRSLGDYQAAKELVEDTLTRRRRVLGEDHPATLNSASGLANVLHAMNMHQEARELDEDVFARRREVLGQNHPDTLTSAYNLAQDLRHLQSYQEARRLDEDTLARRRRVLGESHPDTRKSEESMALNLRLLGEVRASEPATETLLAGQGGEFTVGASGSAIEPDGLVHIEQATSEAALTGTALVTIHGFWSSPPTWERLNAVWSADRELRGLRIHPFGYLSPKKPQLPFSVSRIPDYDDIAQTLANEYITVLAGAQDLAIVTHSQGGLILQRFLAWMIHEGRARELSRIRSVVMLACPNGGAEYLRSVRRALGYGRHPQAGSLDVLNRQVADTQRTVLRCIVNATALDDHQCYIPFHVYAGASDNIVTAASAQAAFPGASALAGNHFTILDPSTPGNRTAEVVKRNLLADVVTRRQKSGAAPAQETSDGAEEHATDRPEGSGKYVINIQGVHGLQIGDHGVQRNVFPGDQTGH